MMIITVWNQVERYVLWCACALWLSGCNPFGGPKINHTSYLLNTPKVARMKAPLVTHVLLQPVHMDPAFAGQLFVKRVGAHRFVRDYHQQFFSPPGQQMTDILYQTMQASGMSRTVSRYGAPMPGLSVRVDVKRFYIDAQPAVGPEEAVVLVWDVQLFRVDEPYQTRWVKTMHHTKRFKVMDGHVIQAMNHGVHHLTRTVLDDVVRYAKAHPLPVHATTLLRERMTAEWDPALASQMAPMLASHPVHT